MSKKIGFLVAATTSAWKPYKDAFEHELGAKGWTIGNGTEAKDVSIDYQPNGGAAGNPDTCASVAKQFVANKVDVIVTAGTEATKACKSAASSIPIVFASAGDPVGCGLVPSLTKPGGNVTGCANMQTDPVAIDSRTNAMLTKMHPKKVGVIGKDNPTVCPIDSALHLALSSVQKAGIEAVLIPLQPTDFQSRQAIKTALTQHEDVDVLLVCSDPLVSANVQYLIQAAHDLKMHTMHEFREPVDQHNGDRSHGPSFAGLFIKAADMVDQILGGMGPGEIDVYVPQPPFEDAP